MYRIYKSVLNQTIDYAAEELKKYMRMLLPDCGDIPIAYAPDVQDGLRIGLMSDFGLDTSDAEDLLLDDIIYISTDEKGGIIAGSNPGATLIAVYRYLRFLGCRWLFPGIDGEWIPIIKELIPVNYRKLADHRYRGQCNEGAEFQQNMLEVIEFTPKIGLNTFMIEFDNPFTYYNTYYIHAGNRIRKPEPVHSDTTLQWKRQCEVEIQKRGLHLHDMGHGWTAEPFGLDSRKGWTSASIEEIPEDTIELLAMMDGERKVRENTPLLTNVCMSNPKARRIMAEYIADYAEKQKHVDFLHIWLADASNGHCECEECQKKITSDWYVILLNEIDRELNRRKLDTHLVFIAYLDTFWTPLVEKLNNNKRFTMLYAPITRSYLETYAEEPDSSKMQPYVRNHILVPRGMSECLAYLHDWKNKMWSGDCVSYEYHFMDVFYKDVTGMYIAELLHKDVKALQKQGIDGMIEDGSQRSYFPTGFPYYVYGETLFDSRVTLEALKEDYFRHAFGDNWRTVLAYLEELCGCMPFTYFYQRGPKDPKYQGKGKFYNPDMSEKAARVHELVHEFRNMINDNRKQYYRASSVSWQMLEIFCQVADMMAEVVEYKCVGRDEEAIVPLARMIHYMSEQEIYIERYFDLSMFAAIWSGMAEGRKIFDSSQTAQRFFN